MTEILLETNKGIVFEKTTSKDRCKVNVKNRDSDISHMVYRYNNGVESISSPFISWENLNCCGGWHFDESYLLTAVQKGKKLVSGIYFSSQKELDDYKENLSDEYVHFCRPPMTNGPHTTYYIDVARDGTISGFINTDEVMRIYEKLGVANFDKKLLSELFTLPLHDFINGETFDYGQPHRAEEFIITGLMLGYPIESTAWLLETHGMN